MERRVRVSEPYRFRVATAARCARCSRGRRLRLRSCGHCTRRRAAACCSATFPTTERERIWKSHPEGGPRRVQGRSMVACSGNHRNSGRRLRCFGRAASRRSPSRPSVFCALEGDPENHYRFAEIVSVCVARKAVGGACNRDIPCRFVASRCSQRADVQLYCLEDRHALRRLDALAN